MTQSCEQTVKTIDFRSISNTLAIEEDSYDPNIIKECKNIDNCLEISPFNSEQQIVIKESHDNLKQLNTPALFLNTNR